METVISIFIALCGLILGSFFNVLIWRLPRNESIVSPGSHCTACQRPIKPWENIPVLSYIFLRGRCAGCGQRISPVYPLVELLTAAGALCLWFWAFPARPLSDAPEWARYIHFGLQCLGLLLMIPVTIIDLRHYIIPDKITISLLIVSLAASLFFLKIPDHMSVSYLIDSLVATFQPGDITPFKSLIGILAGGGTLYAIGWLGKIVFRKGEAMGGGDIKLLAAAGALWGPKIALLTVFFGSLFGSIGAVAIVLAGRLNKDHHIPFGPYLALGLWVAVFAGNHILDAYMTFIGNMVAR